MKKQMSGRLGGFTLIELLVVVLIIGILAAVALPQYQTAVDRARYTQAIAFVDGVSKAKQVYHLANGSYPTSFEDLDIELPTPQEKDPYWIYPWGYCYHGNGDYSATSCRVNTGGGGSVGYVVDLSDSVHPRFCSATKGNKRANQVCKSFTGSGADYSTDTLTYYWM